MPSRVIRSELLTSKTLKAVAPEVELTFIHLLLVVDDYGRFDADPDVLASALYPTRRAITPETVMRHLGELASGPDPAVRFYTVEGRRFLYMTGWEGHRSKAKRGDTSKYPAPPVESVVDPRAPADPRGSPRIPDDPQPGSEYRVASSEYRVASSDCVPESGAPPPPSEVAREPDSPPPKRAPDPPPSDEGVELAELFRAELRMHVEHVRVPAKLDPWARTFDLMLRGTREVDPVPRDRIERVIRFVVRDDFERANVQSADKLRKRFAQLYAKATKPAGGSVGNHNPRSITGALERISARDEQRAARADAVAGQALRVVPRDP